MAPIVKSTRLVISSFGVEMAREVSEWKPKYEYRYNRRVHYYTKVVQWTHEKEVMARLGKFSKNGIIMAQWAWDLYYEVQIQRLKRHVNKDWVLPVFNYFSPLVVEGEVDKCELEEENCDFEFLQPDFVRKLRDKRRRYRDNKRDMRNLMAFIEKYKAWPIVRKVERNGILLAKIRYIISAMRVARSPTDYNKRYCAMMYKLWEKCLSTDSLEVIPQMDGVSVSDNTLLHASNLVEAPTEETELRWTDLCSADELPSYADLVNKWINFDSFDYGLYNQQMLKKYVLPRNVLFSFSNWKTMPNFAPFAVNLFCRTNMRVRLVGNGNPFQQGQVIMAWYYSGSEDINFDQMRVKRGCCIQMPHVIYDVSQNNSAELEIKYWHYHPFLVTRPMHDRQQLDMGNLIIYPMTPLKIGNNGINLVKLSLYIKFEESQFSGAIPESVVTQMDRVLFSAAEGALREMGNFIQRDNPPAIVSPTYVVPTGAHSYSVGTGIDEPLHMLRLDARGQQPGLIPVTDNIGTFKDQLRVWGLLNVISVSKGDAVGTSFYDCRASPFQRDMSKYEKITSSETNMYDSYSFPPITSVASMFMLYRGSIELKFSFISTNYHIFRFMVAYIPGATRVPSYENARACPHATYEVRDEREFVFTVPYINDRPWWRRPWTGGFIQDADDITALVACYVIDPVMPMQSVSEVISIAVYIRGGPDFECSVPLQNSLSLAWNRQAVVEKALETRALDGYAPYYAGGWHSFINGDYAILRYGAGSDHVAQFPKNVTIKPSKKIHYYYEVENKKDSPSYTNDKGVQYLRYVVFLQDGGYTYGVPFSDEDKVKQVIILLGRSNQEWKVAGVPDLLIKVSELIGAQYSNGNPTLKLKSHTRVGDYYDYEVVDAQIETTIARDIRTTGFGLYHFGERFDDIKVLLRRYQPYAMITVNTETPKYPGQALCTIPILPSGLDLQLTDKDGVVEFSNRCREGLIPYILSAYRYARGGLRFKIICSSQIQYWVQHRPDRRLKTNSIMPSLNLGALTGDMVFNHGYGSYVQTMNTITEIEIPYYMESSHLLLQRPNVKANNQAALFSSLGDLAIGLVQPTNSLTELKFYILYSVADDFSFNTFVGYPPCYRLDDIPERIVKTTYVDAQMGLWKYVSSNVAKEVHNSINETGANIMGELKKELASVSLPSCGLDKQVIVNLLSQILHSIMHPDIKTISMSIVTILVSMGLCFYDKLKEFTDVLGRIISRILRVHDPTQQSTEVVAQSEGDILENDKDYGALVSLLYSACTMAVDLKRAIFSKETYKWKQSLVKDLGNNLKSSNQLFIFVRNVVDTVKKIIDQCFTSKFADFWIGRSLKNCSEEISAWAHNALELTDKRVVQNNKTKANYVNKIYDSYNMGQVLISKLTVDSEKKINSNIIFKVFDRVDKVRSDLIELGEHPAVRKEPFAIWLCGPPNVGKSYLYQSLGLSMLKSIGYKAEGELMCQVHPLSDYWDMCEHQPIITVDDIFAVETPDMLSKQLQLMFMVKSPVPLIPPMADLSDKKKRYNPEIFFMSSNKEFLNVNNVDLRAIHRRRNILLKCDLNRTNCMVDGCYHCEFYRDGKNKALNCDVSRIQPSCIRDYHHLRFFLHRNPINQSDGYDGPYTFEEMRDLVVEQFVADRARESERFRNKIQELSSEVTIDDSIPTISDVCDVLYEKYAEMVEREPHWKILKHMVLQLKSSTGLLMNNCQSYISGMAFGVAAQTDNWNTIGDYNELLWEDDKYSTYMKYSKGLQETRMFSDALIKDLIELGRIPCSVTSYEDFIEQLIRICYNNSTRKIRTFSGILEKYAHVIECKHCSIPFNRLTFKDGCWEDRASKFILDNTSCGTGCIYNDVRLQRLYSNALLESSSYRFYYIRNLFSKLPSWFNVEDEEMILIPKNWGQVLMEVGKDILLKGVPTALRMIYSFLADWWPLIIGLLIGCLSSYIQSPVSAVAPQAPIQYDNVIVKDGVRVMPTMLKVVEPQMANESHIIRKVQGNIAYVTAMSGVHTMRCRGLFITERKFLMQRHYFEEFRCFRDKHQDISFYFHNIESKWEVGYLIDLFKLQVQYYGSGANKLDSNYVLVHMPAVIPMHKNLIKYMPSRAQIVHHGSKGCVVNEYVYAGMYVKYEAHRTFTIRPNEYISPITMHGAITYPLQKAGMCGSVVLSDNLDSPLIGMHVAGDSRNDIGIAEPLYKELFSDIKTCVEDVVSPQLLPIDIDKIDIDTAIYSLGKVTKDLVQHQSDKTKISRSLLYGLRPVLTAPNPLDANDARLPQPNGGPLVEGCKHHGRPPLLLPADICMEACDDLRVMMESCNLPFPYSVLSLDEAICGLATRDDFGPLDFSTSAGFPLSKLKGPSDIGKRFLFDLTLTNTGYVLNSIHPRLLQQISVEQALRSKAIKVSTMFVDCLKDTCLPIEKNTILGKTRIFSISPVQYSIVFRQYFAHFLIMYQNNRKHLEHAIGIDATSVEWDELYYGLKQFSPYILAGDYSNYGPSLASDAVQMVCDIILMWYEFHGAPIEDQKIRRILLAELINPYHLAKDFVYQVYSGIPSGSPITAPLNSLVGCVYMRIMWKRITRLPISIFRSHVKLVVYGDDVIAAVKENIIKTFNNSTLSEAFRMYNIKYTNASKSGEILPYEDIDSVTFLKRKFVMHPHRHKVLGQLPYESIYNSLNWIRTDHMDLVEASIVGAKSALDNAYAYGPTFFENLRRDILKKFSYLGHRVELPTWRQLDESMGTGAMCVST